MKEVLTPKTQSFRIIEPGLLSYLVLIVSLGVALCFYFAAANSVFILGAIGLLILRIGLDFSMSSFIAGKEKLSLHAEVVNVLPAFYAEIFIILGITFSTLCHPVFGILGLASLAVASYTGIMGKAVGVDWQDQGPLNRPFSLILILLASLGQFILIKQGNLDPTFFSFRLFPLEWCMLLFLVLGQFTVCNRVKGIFRKVKKIDWIEKEKYKTISKKIMLIYDSTTGNTEKVAEEISFCLKSGIKKIDNAETLGNYDLVIFGTPNLGNRPSEKIISFLATNKNVKNYAVFVTYASLWGKISSCFCVLAFKKVLNKDPLAVLFCKIKHGDPAESVLLDAFLFGIKAAEVAKALK